MKLANEMSWDQFVRGSDISVYFSTLTHQHPQQNNQVYKIKDHFLGVMLEIKNQCGT